MDKHKHHIIPRHMGGSDEPDNLIELTVEEHALAHKTLYETYGRIQDKIAWLMLSGRTTEGERLRKVLSKKGFHKFLNDPAKKMKWQLAISKTLTGRKHSKETVEKRTNSILIAYKEGRKKAPVFPREHYVEMAKLGKEASAAGRRNSVAWNAFHQDPEYKKKKSEIHKQAISDGKVFGEEHRRKISKAKKGKKHSPEHRESNSKAKLGCKRFHNPSTGKNCLVQPNKISEAITNGLVEGWLNNK